MILSSILLPSIAFAIVDTNNNGMSDIWEQHYNSEQLFTDLDPQADFDGDGYSNLNESIAGTDPKNGTPPEGFLIAEVIHAPAVYTTPEGGGDPVLETAEGFIVGFPSLPGKQYTILYSPDLTEGSWGPVGNAVTGTGDVLQLPVAPTYSDGTMVPAGFWRVGVSNADSDNDGLTDTDEYLLGTNPNNAHSDSDGLPDGWEVANGLDPNDSGIVNTANGAAGDPDGDGLSNLLEWQHGGSAHMKDTDGDGMDDGPEYFAGLLINDADQNHNGSTDGYEDFDSDHYANREEALAGTNPLEGTIRPDGISNPSNPVLLLQNYSGFRFIDMGHRGAECWKPGFKAFETGIIEIHENEGSTGGTGYFTEKELQNHPKYYLTSTTENLGSYAYHIQFYLEGEPEHLFSGCGGGSWNVTEETIKENGLYHSIPVESGEVHYEDLLDGELTYDETYVFGVDPDAQWLDLDEWTYGGLQMRSSTETFEEWNYDIFSVYDPNAGSGTNKGSASRKVNLSSEYKDQVLVADLRSKLADELYSNPSGSAPPGASFLWEKDHSKVSMSDGKYRIETTSLPPGVLPNAKVVFVWKEVFESQDGKERTATWRSATVTATGGGTYTTGVYDILHPDKPGSVTVAPVAAALAAPDILRALNPGEAEFLESTETAADGQTYVLSNPASSESIRFQLGLDEQKSSPTLRATGAGSVALWEKEKDGTWQSCALPFTIPAEQAAGPASEPGQYCIQGVQPGDVAIEVLVGGLVTSSRTIRVVRTDLDIDSDNTGELNTDIEEEKIESDATKPGKIILGSRAAESNEDGIPIYPDELIGLKIQTANLPAGTKLSLTYPKQILRIWNCPPGQSPGAGDLIKPGEPCTLGTNSELSIQSLGSAAGLVRIGVAGCETSDEVLVNLIPAHFIRRDVETGETDEEVHDIFPSDPRPQVELHISSAEIDSNGDVQVTVAGVVTDRLSEVVTVSRISTLKIYANGKEKDSIPISYAAGTPPWTLVNSRNEFERTINVGKPKPGGYEIRAETDENAAGNKGWGRVAVGHYQTSTSGPGNGVFNQLSVIPPVAFSPTAPDMVTVYLADRAPLPEDPVFTEDGADTFRFTGTLQIGGQSAACTLELAAEGAPHANAPDAMTAVIRCSLPGLADQTIVTGLQETLAGSHRFSPDGFQVNGEETVQLDEIELPGSQNNQIEPFLVKIKVSAACGKTEDFSILVNGDQHQLRKFDFGDGEFLYVTSPEDTTRPKIFVPCQKPLPAEVTLKDSLLAGDFIRWEMDLDGIKSEIARLLVLPGAPLPEPNEDGESGQSQPAPTAPDGISPSDGGPAVQSPSADQRWQEPGDPITWDDLYDAYHFIYPDELSAALLRVYLEEGHHVSLEDVWNDFDFSYYGRAGTKALIKIENDDEDVHPGIAAQYLWMGLTKALASSSFRAALAAELNDDNLEIAAINLYKQQVGPAACTYGIAAAELYLSGFSIVNEAGDWLLIMNEVSEGNYASLAGALPFIPANLVKVGKTLKVTNRGRQALAGFTADQMTVLQDALRTRDLNGIGTVMDDIDATLFLTKVVSSDGGQVRIPIDRYNLTKNMLRRVARPSEEFIAHHDFIFCEARWFAIHGINVSDAFYGRWITKAEHDLWHEGADGGEFNQFWKDVIKDEETRVEKYTKQEIIEKLAECRNQFPRTIHE